jgi:hypothetical protein
MKLTNSIVNTVLNTIIAGAVSIVGWFAVNTYNTSVNTNSTLGELKDSLMILQRDYQNHKHDNCKLENRLKVTEDKNIEQDIRITKLEYSSNDGNYKLLNYR